MIALDPHISAGLGDDILQQDDINGAGVALAVLLVAVATMDLGVPEIAKLTAGVAWDDVVPNVLDGSVFTADGSEGCIVQRDIPVDNDAVLVVPHGSEHLIKHPVLLGHWHAPDEKIMQELELVFFIQVSFEERNTGVKENTDQPWIITEYIQMFMPMLNGG